MHTHQATHIAIGDAAKSVRRNLLHLGMRRCSLRLVYRQGEAPIKSQRIGWYCAFWRFFQALWRANRAGAEFLYEDFRSRVQVLRDQDGLDSHDWTGAVAQAVDECADAIREAVLDRDQAAIKKELVEAIAICRKLLAMVEARATHACLTSGQGAATNSSRSPVRLISRG